jgi:hypothetical protein
LETAVPGTRHVHRTSPPLAPPSESSPSLVPDPPHFPGKGSYDLRVSKQEALRFHKQGGAREGGERANTRADPAGGTQGGSEARRGTAAAHGGSSSAAAGNGLSLSARRATDEKGGGSVGAGSAAGSVAGGILSKLVPDLESKALKWGKRAVSTVKDAHMEAAAAQAACLDAGAGGGNGHDAPASSSGGVGGCGSGGGVCGSGGGGLSAKAERRNMNALLATMNEQCLGAETSVPSGGSRSGRGTRTASRDARSRSPTSCLGDGMGAAEPSSSFVPIAAAHADGRAAAEAAARSSPKPATEAPAA